MGDLAATTFLRLVISPYEHDPRLDGPAEAHKCVPAKHVKREFLQSRSA